MMNNLKDLLVNQIKDLYSAETQLVSALPKMEAAANSQDLKAAFREHLAETENHVNRLVEVCNGLGIDPQGEHCEAMEGLIKESEETLNELADPDVKDAALIAAAQRIEHYEIAGYGTVCTYCERLKESDAKGKLGKTLSEEKSADEKLKKIATGGLFSSGINKAAAHS